MLALNVAPSRQVIASIQSKVALRVCSAYRTVSEDAACEIAAISPIELLAKERTLLMGLRPDDRILAGGKVMKKQIVEEWQAMCDTTSKSEWTRRVVHKVDHTEFTRGSRLSSYLGPDRPSLLLFVLAKDRKADHGGVPFLWCSE